MGKHFDDGRRCHDLLSESADQFLIVLVPTFRELTM
jgi:hypothetical protein